MEQKGRGARELPQLDTDELRLHSGETTDPEVESVDVVTQYEEADEFDPEVLSDHYKYSGFVAAVLERMGYDYEPSDGRLVDQIADPDDVDFGALVAFPSGDLVFLGSDPTAKDSIPWFAFSIRRAEPLPAPRTAPEALDLLKPPEVKDVEAESDWLPGRHGEWWLLPTDLMAAGSVFKPGVSHSPYGPSPLGNHVPRAYAFTVSDSTFMERFRERAPGAPKTLETPDEVIEWTFRQSRKVKPAEDALTWTDIREIAGDVLVRGTIRHRESDHFVMDVGDTWHQALTHDIEVYTGDSVATDIHLDYHGQ